MKELLNAYLDTIVVADEPSTGMDPEARRFMWHVIASTMSGRSVSKIYIRHTN